MVKKKRKIQMPSSIRKKMMAATSMLLVSAILMVTTSYAWFTLSTAPEVTGITTSVGANGNLEMALLTTESFANTELITSNTGDSMDAAGKNATTANITWGNLVDLRDESYGLSKITLYPSALNTTSSTAGEGSSAVTTKTLGTAPLSFPEYGSDGRVSKLSSTTVSAIYNNGKFAYDANSNSQDYGVRAVGTSASVSLNTLVLRSARNTYNAKVNGATTPITNAVNAHKTTFALLALSGATSAPTSYSRDQLVAVKDIATGVQTALNSVVNAYANAMLAKAATTVTDETILSELQTNLANVTDATSLRTVVGNDSNIAEKYADDITALETAQSNVKTAVDEVTSILANSGDTFTTAQYRTIESKIITPILGGLSSTYVKAYESDKTTEVTDLKNNVAKVAYICLKGGAVKTIADYVGTYKISQLLEYEIHGGDLNTTGSKMSTVTEAVNGLTITSTGTVDTSISDFYGYILDFAFRTNAGGTSELRLQTTPANRVYDDGAGTALQGSGSTVTYTYDTTSTTNVDQAKNLLDAIRIVFFDPDTMNIYSSAKLGNINPGTVSATADVLIIDGETKTTETKYDYVYTVGKDAYEEVKDGDTVTGYKLKETIVVANVSHDLANSGALATITAEVYNNLPATTSVQYKKLILGKDAYTATVADGSITGYATKSSITVDGLTQTLTSATITAEAYAALPDTTTASGISTSTTSTTLASADAGIVTSLNQNEVKKVSVLVYLDGENIDNTSVANATKSGDLKLNLQFSSSADLHPMENNTLKNMDKTTTE